MLFCPKITADKTHAMRALCLRILTTLRKRSVDNGLYVSRLDWSLVNQIGRGGGDFP
ncbi:hypothetical protein VIC_001167 [Vibrio coralliilyticus ATCC BAA-450]|nr:hypothetical protein VIC_001167 [Vibrio coralliilyticus ATCC BAA-450]